MVAGEVGRLNFGGPDFLKKSNEVCGQFFDLLTGFAQREVDDGELGLGFVGNCGAGAHLFGAGSGIGDDGPVFGVGHQAFGAENFSISG